MTTTTESPQQLAEAIDFLKAQGFQINYVDGIYRVRKEGWSKRPYEVNAKTVIEQADLIKKHRLVHAYCLFTEKGEW